MAKESAPAPDPQPDAEPVGFEASLRAAEQAVASLESGQLDLDAALASYEKGVRMLAHCHALLEAAERKVSLVKQTAPGAPAELVAFEPADGTG
jgi:exodeoxyribonuclease VII small subunit